jgi:dynein heavy chain
VVGRINPVIKGLLQFHLEDLERRLEPGLTTITWTSMHIEKFLTDVDHGIFKLDDLVTKMNDIIENRIENNLKIISRTMLVDLDEDKFPFVVDDFESVQEQYVRDQSAYMDAKNLEVEMAVQDLLDLVDKVAAAEKAHGGQVMGANPKAIPKLIEHYNRLMYHAILTCMKNSFNLIKKKVSGGSNKGLAGLVSDGVSDTPFFQADIELDVTLPTAVVMKPSLDEIQDVINNTAIAILRCTKKLMAWGQDRSKPKETLDSFFEELGREKEVVKYVLLLTGSLLGAKIEVSNYLDSFGKYSHLWEKNMQTEYDTFIGTDPTLEDFDDRLTYYVSIENEIQSAPKEFSIGVLALLTGNITNSLQSLVTLWKSQYTKNLLDIAREDLSSIVEYINNTTRKFNMSVDHLDDVRKLVGMLKDVVDKESVIEWDFGPLEEKYDMLQRYGVKSLTKDELFQVTELRANWEKLKALTVDVADNLGQHQATYKENLVRDVKAFKNQVKTYRADYEKNGPGVKGIAASEAIERLNRHEREFADLDRKYNLYNAGETLFGMPQTDLDEMTKTRKELKLLRQLYGLYENVDNAVIDYNDILWTDVLTNIDTMTNQVADFQRLCKNMPKALKTWQAYDDLKVKIEGLLETIPLLQFLSNKAMRPRHWEAVEEVTNVKFDIASETFKVGNLLEADLLSVDEDIEEISGGATKELNVEMKLQEIEEMWSDKVFSFAGYKSRNGVFILKGGETSELQEMLEESLMNLGGMASSRYALPFKEDVDLWLAKLGETTEVIERWLYLQMLWMNLEAVFTGGDIAKQLPQDSKRFVNIDKSWVKLMSKAFDTRNVVGLCYANDMLKFLEPLIEGLETCQKSLASYLESKRALFPRFYFVSDPVLLEILSQGSDPPAIQPYFQACFDSIDWVDFDETNKKNIIQINAQIGSCAEIVELSQVVVAEGNIEEWLARVEKEMQDTIHNISRQASVDCMVQDIQTFSGAYCSQVCLMGLQMQWTHDSQDGIAKAKSDKNAMSTAQKKISQLMMDLCVMTTNDTLDKRDRTNIETLITIQVHNKDIFDALYKQKLKDPTDFAWMQQLRFYYREEQDDAFAECCDRQFAYCHEFLGCTERLVITPLTDRCYITLTQALGMIKGGAPAGPAGTGKTETTKDLARALGKYCVVTNCGPEMDIMATGKIYKGIAMCGAWGCFDEFNRIDLEVLSVCAQQIACVLSAIRDKKSSFQFLDGQNLDLNPLCGYFITMNPGYAGRQELPENLKELFRGVTMMVPDRQIIMKVKLAAAGYQEYQPLSVKFHTLYRLCEQQLSKQPHYDFGLRNILSVLRTAGAQLRVEKKKAEAPPEEGQKPVKMKSESYLLCRTLRDMNMSKYVAEDVGLFISLINDLFPGLNPEKAVFPDIEAAIEAEIQNVGLVLHPKWVSKIVQLYETYLVRHGIMVVGSAGCGKTKITSTLQAALTAVVIKHTSIKMNPKGVTPKQMYGFQDPVANEWTEGVFTALWKRSNDPKKKGVNQWMVMDGPVDAIWIEDLNTVLDDNRMLTCANGDRIPMLSSMKIMFEPENLNNASPATVSRAGIIYVSATDLGWIPIIDAWLNQRPNAQERESLTDTVKEIMQNAVTFALEGGCKQVMKVEDMNLVNTFLCVLNGLLPPLKEKDSPLPPDALTRKAILACVWSVPVLYESEGRDKFEAAMRTWSCGPHLPPEDSGKSIFDWSLDETHNWAPWKVSPLDADPEKFEFSSLLIPTIDSTRVEFFMGNALSQRKPVLLVGGPGTSKTSIAMMYIEAQPKTSILFKRMNFSSATTPFIFQQIIESSVEKRSGKIFGPPANKKLLCFVDDFSMPLINNWGDQVTLEIVRQLVELGYLWNLEKSKAGEQQFIEDLLYVFAMNHPGGGKNDIPQRMKRHCANWNIPMPSMASINQIFGAILGLRFTSKDFKPEAMANVKELVPATMDLYNKAFIKLLPTPAKFHYIFNLRDVSRVFQGMMTVPKPVLQNPTNTTLKAPEFLVALWRHECLRVFQDKLIEHDDKEWLDKTITQLITQYFASTPVEAVTNQFNLVDWLRDAPEDPETGEPAGPRPKVYEAVKDLDALRDRATVMMELHNEGVKTGKLNLVLFDDALKHLAIISRIIMMPRGSALLVGVGGSGKQSLTKLSTYLCDYKHYQITVSKTYNAGNLMEDIKSQYMLAGFSKPVTFVFTDAEVKEEGFLEYINMILSTGEIPGLLAKDEVAAMIAELSPIYEKETGDEAANDKVIKYFYNTVRANLHMVLCFSPVGSKFRDRALKFPALFSATTIDWFLPWPEQALQKVANSFLATFPVKVDNDKVKLDLVNHIAAVHNIVADQCTAYFGQFRRSVYVTPKSYLSFIDFYMEVYKRKFEGINNDAEKIGSGLLKLQEAEEDVAKMKIELAETEKILEVTGERIKKMVINLKDKAGKAEKVKAEVLVVKNDCQEVASKIGADRDECNKELEAAQPALKAAESALDAIRPDDIKSLKALKNPPNIIKRIFDGVILLTRGKIDVVKMDPEVTTKGGAPIMLASFDTTRSMMNDPKFLDVLKNFDTDTITDETCELLYPYLEMDDFTTEMAAKASGNVAGLCDWCSAMVEYFFIAKFVAPKIESLKLAEAKLAVANQELGEAEAELNAKEAELKGLNDEYAAAMAEAQKTQDEADATKAKMDAANKLIGGLGGEKIRWTAQSKEFAATIRRLVGDTAMACAFLSYCGPFNAIFRKKLLEELFKGDCVQRSLPVSDTMNPVTFICDETTVGSWALEGLPTDSLSLENGVITTKASRWPVIVDPQNQGNTWIRNREGPNELTVTTLSAKYFRRHLEDSMANGTPLLIENIEEELDPVLDPVLNKAVIRTGKFLKINLPDKEGCEYSDKFRLYFTTKLANPHYTPELSAQTTIIDFTVTMQGLEDQMLSIVVNHERPDLEEQRVQLVKDITDYKAKVAELEEQLLYKLANVEGNLLDDKDILDVLNNTKTTANEVAQKLSAAADTQATIQTTCEDYRPVATRGSVMYFLIVECSQINPMYQVSLLQFLELFDISMAEAEAGNSVQLRCKNIIETNTHTVFQYITRGLFERHKLLFVLLLCLKIKTRAGELTQQEFDCLLKGGAALDLKSQKRKPAEWIPDNAWLNMAQAELSMPCFKGLLDEVIRDTATWQEWYDFEDPEAHPIPVYDGRIKTFEKMVLLRSIRPDRFSVSAQEYIAEALGKKYLIMKPLDIEATWEESTNITPLVFLLSPGSNPNAAIMLLAKRRKIPINAISMGQGQEIKAAEFMDGAVVTGSWVLLQNTHLGLGYMRTLEEYISAKNSDPNNPIDPAFRLWVTSEPHPQFPIGLLQISIKMTDEPPSGIKAGLRKSYNWIDTDWLEAVNRDEWRPMIFALCFMHTIVQERRKFGPLGFCIPYEFNQSDLEASAIYMRNHMTEVEFKKGQVSWIAVSYMVCEVQYGGRITDDIDRRLFNTYGTAFLNAKIFDPAFQFFPGYKVLKFPAIGQYREAIEEWPDVDNPGVFGLHSNGDLTYRTKETGEMLTTIMDIQPKDAGGGDGGPTREEQVLAQADSMLNAMPKTFDMVQVKKDIQKLNGGANAQPKPLNVHLGQEVDRMQIIIGITRRTLQNLKLAIAGTVIMTSDLSDALDSIFTARVPALWTKKSWISPTLGVWFSNLCNRTAELVNWLGNGRPKSFWLTGFFNAQGFLTAVQQEVTRRHNGWSLDDVLPYSEMTAFEKEDIEKKERIEEGVYIWGLFLDGAAWDKKKNSLADAPPKKLFVATPCLFFTACKRGEQKKQQEYMAPCYTIPRRTGLHYVFTANLKCDDPPSFWTLRGVALLCSKD